MIQQNISTMASLAMVAAAALTGCQTAVPTTQPATEVNLQTTKNPFYRIAPGDELGIKFFYHPDMNEQMVVRPDGAISVPMLQDVMVAGKTPADVGSYLREALAAELKDPVITVIVRRASGAVAYVGGEVRTPQMIRLDVPTTLLQAVIRSGEVLPSAKQSTVLVLRAVPGGKPLAIKANLRRIRAGKERDVMLASYDVVYVPKTHIAEIGMFVDQYINNIIPRNVTVSFPFLYEIRSDD